MSLCTIKAGDYCLLPTFPIAITGSYTGLEIIVRIWAGKVEAPDWVIEKDLDDAGMTFDTGVLTVEILEADWPAEALTAVENAKVRLEVETTVAEVDGPVSSKWHDVKLLAQAVGRP